MQYKKNYSFKKIISKTKYIFISFSLIYLIKMFNYNFNIIVSTLLNLLIYIFLIMINNVVEKEDIETKNDKLFIKIFFVLIFFCFRYYFALSNNDLFDNILFIALISTATLQMVLDFIVNRKDHCKLSYSVNNIQTISLAISLIILIIDNSFNVFSMLIVYIISYILLIIYSIIRLHLFKIEKKETKFIKQKNILKC